MPQEIIRQVMRTCGELHITAKQLSKECDITPGTVSRLFNGDEKPNSITKHVLAEWLQAKGVNEMDTSTVERLNEAIDKLEKVTDNPWIKGKKKFAKWLDVSYQTLDKMLVEGLPVHFIGDSEIYFFNKNEVNEYLLNK